MSKTEYLQKQWVSLAHKFVTTGEKNLEGMSTEKVAMREKSYR